MPISEFETIAGCGAVDRLALLLESASASRQSIGLTDLTTATGMKKPTVYWIAERLVDHGMLSRRAVS